MWSRPSGTATFICRDVLLFCIHISCISFFYCFSPVSLYAPCCGSTTSTLFLSFVFAFFLPVSFYAVLPVLCSPLLFHLTHPTITMIPFQNHPNTKVEYDSFNTFLETTLVIYLFKVRSHFDHNPCFFNHPHHVQNI